MFRHGASLDLILIVLFIAATKRPIKNYIGKEGLILAHSSRVRSVLVGQSWLQGHEAAGHRAPVITEQRDRNMALSSLSPFDSFWDRSPRMVLPAFRIGPTSLGSLMCTLKGIFPW